MLPTSEERQKGTSGVYTLKREMAAKSSKRFQSAVSLKLEKGHKALQTFPECSFLETWQTDSCSHFQSVVFLKLATVTQRCKHFQPACSFQRSQWVHSASYHYVSHMKQNTTTQTHCGVKRFLNFVQGAGSSKPMCKEALDGQVTPQVLSTGVYGTCGLTVGSLSVFGRSLKQLCVTYLSLASETTSLLPRDKESTSLL